MKTIHVTASRDYDVLVGPGLLRACGPRIAAVTGACTAAVITESTVAPLYLDAVCASLAEAGFSVIRYVFPAGEESKTLSTYGSVLSFLAENRLTRSDILVALGGGVTGDMAGFAAATYQRGIRFVQLPTTLLSMVDSSVGGKTAVDLPAGKNMAGAFWQPSLVLCDTDALSTLPESVYRDGCAEIVKTGVLAGERLFSAVEKGVDPSRREEIIAACVEFKRSIVAEDEYDTGKRHLLNLGHTAGHAAERLSDYSISHGRAVAMGLGTVVRACARRGLCPADTAERILSALERSGLPTALPYAPKDLAAAALADKKREGDRLPLIVIRGIGDCRIETIPGGEFEIWLQDGGAV